MMKVSFQWAKSIKMKKKLLVCRSLCAAVLFLSACSSQEEADLKKAQASVAEGHNKQALTYFDHVIKRNATESLCLEAAREGARVAFYELHDYQKSAEYQHYIVLHSGDQRERVEAQKQIAQIYFNNLQNYQQAILEFSKLQEMPHSDLEEAQYQMDLARADYYLNNLFQAQSEIESLLKLKSDENVRFGALMLKGNILVAEKKFGLAADIFRDLIEKYPEKSTQENVALTLAVCYEENNDFKSAIKVLEQYRGKYNPPEYIELRIKKLQERMRNAPGAKGFHK